MDNSPRRSGTRGETHKYADNTKKYQASPELSAELDAKAITSFRKRRWHPLLHLHVRQIGDWRGVAGFDPVSQRETFFLTKARIRSDCPTLILLDQPGFATCSVEQIYADYYGDIRVEKGRGWVGVSRLTEARTAKLARNGDPQAMYLYADLRSFRLMRSQSFKESLAQMDVDAARYWFLRAAKAGYPKAGLKLAYLDDLVNGFERTPIIDAAMRTIWEQVDRREAALDCASRAINRERQTYLMMVDECTSLIQRQASKVFAIRFRSALVDFFQLTKLPITPRA